MTHEDLVHLRRARDLIDREYDRPLDVPAMARAAHASPAHFARCYREAFGETPWQHLLTGGSSGLTVGSPDQPAVDIGLLRLGPPLPPADVDVVRDRVTTGSMHSLIFGVEDCPGTFERLRKAVALGQRQRRHRGKRTRARWRDVAGRTGSATQRS